MLVALAFAVECCMLHVRRLAQGSQRQTFDCTDT